MTIEETNAAVMRRIYEGYAEGDTGPMFDSLAEDVRFGINARPDQFRFAGMNEGIPWSKRVIKEINEDYEWLEFGLRELICQGDRAVALTGGRIVHRASGAVVDVDLVDIARLRDGKVVEFIEYFDSAGLLAQQSIAASHKVPVRRASSAKTRAKAKPKAKAKARAQPKPRAKPKAQPKPKAKRRPARRR